MPYDFSSLTEQQQTPIETPPKAEQPGELPILSGIPDADNQPLRLDLPVEVLSRLRRWSRD